MSGLARDGTAKPVSRGRILRRELGEGKNRFPVQLTLAIIPGLFVHYAESTDHTYHALHEKLYLHTRRALLV